MISKDFLTGGHAIFTVTNPTGEYYTYRVTTPRDFNEMYPVYFVSLLTGPNNTQDYTYLGILKGNGHVNTTAKSKFDKDSKPVKVAQYFIWLAYHNKPLPEGYRMEHIGRCGRCGRPLTTPASIESGIGPVCEGRE